MIRLTQLTLLVLFFNLSSALAQRPYSGGPVSEAQAAKDIKHYHLDLTLDPERRTLGGRVDVYFTINAIAEHWELDLHPNFEVHDIQMDDENTLEFEREARKIYIRHDGNAKIGDLVKLSIFYSGFTPIAPNAPWEGGFSFAKSPNGNHWVGLSCQNDGADIFMPCKDQPYDKPDSVRMQISVPKGYQAIGNGILEGMLEGPNQDIYTWATFYPINNYSINFTIGKFSNYQTSYTSVDGNDVKVDVYLLEENAAQLETLANMAIDNLMHHEQFFGEYPFAKEKFGLVETPYLGMEHQTINAYGNQFRYTTVQGKSYDWLLLHELGHEWWANKVTAADWADFWIHEGLCSFSDALYLHSNFGWEEYWKKMSQTRNGITNQKPIVLGRNINSVEAYHPGVYGKASFVLHMLWDMIGDDLFFGSLYDFANNDALNYHNTVGTDDFIRLVNEKTGEDFTEFFRFFFESTEIPEVLVTEGEDGDWRISIPNIRFTLPLEVHTSEDILRLDLGPNPTSVLSKTRPEIDPEGLYLRKITFR
jgi:aminopeptidase N